uniref:Putative secreted protein n=1 Tax=Anopheles marajoara TaxID=58244 RepID=A0A2M4C956_9DIPT
MREPPFCTFCCWLDASSSLGCCGTYYHTISLTRVCAAVFGDMKCVLISSPVVVVRLEKVLEFHGARRFRNFGSSCRALWQEEGFSLVGDGVQHCAD